VSFVVCPVCGNVGCFELVDGEYTAKRAVEYMQCCRCGEVVRVVLEA
jgi:primosomal protein N'